MYYSNKDIRIEEAPVPETGPGEVLVKVFSSGICGSDVMQWYRAGKTPLVLGHEIAGEIVKTGEGVAGYKAGQRVAASHHVPCNTCHYCLKGRHTVCDTLRGTNFRPGGFSEYVLLPPINVDRGIYPLPEGVAFDDATFIEPLACVLRGQRAAGVGPGLSVLVIGSGISGLLHIRLAKALGASFIASTDIEPFRIKAAGESGAQRVFHASEDVPGSFRAANGGRGADVVVVTTGSDGALAQAVASVDRGGTVLFFAPSAKGAKLSIPFNELFWRNEITLTSTYAATYAEHRAAMELIRTRKIEVADLITHTLPLSEIGEGFRLVEEAKESIKVIIRPQE